MLGCELDQVGGFIRGLTYRQNTVTNEPNLHLFGLWKEARTHGNPPSHRENMQTSHRKPQSRNHTQSFAVSVRPHYICTNMLPINLMPLAEYLKAGSPQRNLSLNYHALHRYWGFPNLLCTAWLGVLPPGTIAAPQSHNTQHCGWPLEPGLQPQPSPGQKSNISSTRRTRYCRSFYLLNRSGSK